MMHVEFSSVFNFLFLLSYFLCFQVDYISIVLKNILIYNERILWQLQAQNLI